MHRNIRRAAGALSALLIGSFAAADDVIVPGFNVSTYADLTNPAKISFADDRKLYVGRDGVGQNESPQDLHYVRAIEPGGFTVNNFGAAALNDPDAILVDNDGGISGVPGSVLVGSRLQGAMAAIHAIAPDGTISQLMPPTTAAENPTQFLRFGDSLIFSDYDRSDLKIWSEGTLNTLTATPSPVFSLTQDTARERIYAASIDGVIRMYDTTGALLDPAVLTNLGDTIAMTYVPEQGRSDAVDDDCQIPGGALYVVNTTGELLRLTDEGELSVLGSGFDFAYDMMLGPDGALYVSEYEQDRIVRIACVPEPGTLAGLLVCAIAALRRR